MPAALCLFDGHPRQIPGLGDPMRPLYIVGFASGGKHVRIEDVDFADGGDLDRDAADGFACEPVVDEWDRGAVQEIGGDESRDDGVPRDEAESGPDRAAGADGHAKVSGEEGESEGTAYGPVEEPAVGHACVLCPVCDEVKVCPDPDFLQGDDIELCVVRVCDPVCDGCDALSALVGEEPQSPKEGGGGGGQWEGGTTVGRNDVPAVESEHSQPRPLGVCHRLPASRVAIESNRARPHLSPTSSLLGSSASPPPGAEQKGAEYMDSSMPDESVDSVQQGMHDVALSDVALAPAAVSSLGAHGEHELQPDMLQQDTSYYGDRDGWNERRHSDPNVVDNRGLNSANAEQSSWQDTHTAEDTFEAVELAGDSSIQNGHSRRPASDEHSRSSSRTADDATTTTPPHSPSLASTAPTTIASSSNDGPLPPTAPAGEPVPGPSTPPETKPAPPSATAAAAQPKVRATPSSFSPAKSV